MALKLKSLELFVKRLPEMAMVKLVMRLPNPSVKKENWATLLNNSYLHLLLAMVIATQLSAQQFIDGQKLEVLEHQVVVQNSHEAVWKALSAFGNVSTFHTTIDDSMTLNGSEEEAKLGAEREVQIPDGITNIINKERIVTFIDGVYYTYEVYESENFPTKKMQVTYGVRLDEKGRTILFSKTFYKLNNVINTKFLKRKLKKFSMDSLLAYKYYIETGERNTDIKILRKRYQKEDHENNPDYIAVNH